MICLLIWPSVLFVLFVPLLDDGTVPSFFSKVTFKVSKSARIANSGQCVVLQDGTFAQFIIAFLDRSLNTKIVINNLNKCGNHPEVSLLHLTRSRSLSLKSLDVSDIYDNIHVISIFDTAYSPTPSSVSFVLNDLTNKNMRDLKRTIVVKCDRANCLGKEIGEASSTSVTCDCSD
jgi:hypothetical protein